MTSRERTLTAYRGGQPDRVPVRIWGVEPGMEPPHPVYAPLVAAAQERTDMVASWAAATGVFMTVSDEVSVRTEERPSRHAEYRDSITTYTTPAGEITSVFTFSPAGRPGYTAKYLLETREDIERLLSIPYVPPRPDVSSYFEKQERLGDEAPICVGFGVDAMYAVNSIMGSETFAIMSIEDRATLRRLLDVFQQRTYEYLEYLLQQGVGPLFGYVGPELCIPPLQSPMDFDEFVVPYDRELADLVHRYGGIMWVHCHGRMGPVLEKFADMHADCLNPIEPPPMGDVTLAEAKRRVGGRLALEGNIQSGDFYRVTPDQMRRLVRRALEEGAPGGGFTLCPTSTPWNDPTVDGQTIDNWLAFIDEASNQ
ncbi:MAG TPA: uroporphyrinogen decarboxylase family protein [Armatimonadota bacterium]|nr:uroporphyrinogen decarboxylase family protein [Armatimonadota bacterium]